MGDPSVDAYLAALPEARRNALTRVRSLIEEQLPAGFEEALEFGMPSWVIPLARYPKTYNKRPLMLAALGSQKHHMAIYLMGIYGDADLRAWFEDAYRATGKRLDVGRSCVRFRTLEELPLELIGEAIGRVDVAGLIAMDERAHSTREKPAAKKPAAKKPAAKKPAAKKPAAKKPAAKKPAAKKPAAKKPAAKKPAAKKPRAT